MRLLFRSQASGTTSPNFVEKTVQAHAQAHSVQGVAREFTMKVLITGASRGIGAEFCRQLCTEKWSVGEIIAFARNPLASNSLRELQTASQGRLKVVALDLDDDQNKETNAAGLLDRIRKVTSLESLDLVINSAGIFGREGAGFAEFDFEVFRRSFEVNTLGPFKVLQAIAPMLQKSQAKVVQITSLMGSIADNQSGGSYAYRASKAALNMMNKSFSIDVPHLISVVLHPGWVQTDMGGPNAQITPQFAVQSMLEVIKSLQPKSSGRYLNFDGSELPW